MTTKKKTVKKTAKNSDDKIVTIPRIHWRTITLCIEGITPLMIQCMPSKVVGEIADKQSGKAQAKKAPRVPEQECEDALHRNKDGWPSLPCAAFKHALIRAGDMIDGLVMLKLSRLLFVSNPPDQMIRVYGDYRMDITPVRINNGQTTIPRYRPKFDSWALEFDVDFVANELTEEHILGLADRAFQLGGMGDGRPTSPKNRAMDFGRAKLVRDIDSYKKRFKKQQERLA